MSVPFPDIKGELFRVGVTGITESHSSGSISDSISYLNFLVLNQSGSLPSIPMTTGSRLILKTSVQRRRSEGLGCLFWRWCVS